MCAVNDSSLEVPEYWCFISYRHADNKQAGRQWASWLHKSLETYEIPPVLVGRRNDRGDVIPNRIYPVFRDEEELPADARLSKPIEAALAKSRSLVVLSSPHAVVSRFVAEEILRFRRLRAENEDRLFAAIIAGDPTGIEVTDIHEVSDVPYERRQCFPSALRHMLNSTGDLVEAQFEPIAADFRLPDGHEGFTETSYYRNHLLGVGTLSRSEISVALDEFEQRMELMKLKIIAGIIGVPLGVLTERDKAYQLAVSKKRARRLRIVAAAFAVLAAIACVLGWVAEVQKEYAEDQQAIAGRERDRAETETRRTWQANRINKENLHRASMADLAGAVKAWQEDYDAVRKGEHSAGDLGRSRWHEAVALLSRSLERDPSNKLAAMWLYDTIQHRTNQKRDWPLQILQHEGQVSSVSFSRDGTLLLVTYFDSSSLVYSAHIWNLITERAVCAPINDIVSARFNPDGTRVIIVDSQSVQVLDAYTGRAIHRPLRHLSPIVNASFSNDGAFLFVVGKDKSAWGVDTATGTIVGKSLQIDSHVSSAGFSPDVPRVVTTSKDLEVQVWDIVAGRTVGAPLLHEERVAFASVSPDGSKVLTVTGELHKPGTVRIWNGISGDPVITPLRHQSVVQQATFSPDGTLFVTASGQTAQVWDAASGAAQGKPLLHPSWVNSVSFSPDGARVLTTCGSGGEEPGYTMQPGHAQVWEAVTGNPIGEPLQHEWSVETASFSHDGRYVVTASGDKTAQIWEVASELVIGEPLRHPTDIRRAVFSPDGSCVAVACEDNVQLWDLTTHRKVGGPLSCNCEITSDNFSHDGRYFVSAKTVEAKVYATKTGEEVGGALLHEGEITSASFSPDGTHIVTGSRDDSAQVWDAISRDFVGKLMLHKADVLQVKFNPDGKRVLTVCADNAVRVWDFHAGKVAGAVMQHPSGVVNAHFSPKGRQIVTTCGSEAVRIWDAISGMMVGEPLVHEDQAHNASFSPDGARLLTIYGVPLLGEPGYARIWDAVTRRPLGEQMCHKSLINDAAFSPDGMTVITAVADKPFPRSESENIARIWDLAGGRPVGEPLRHAEGVRSVSFTNDQSAILTVSEADTAWVWNTAAVQASEEFVNLAAPDVEAVLKWSQHIAGLRYSENGELEVVPNEERRTAILTPRLPAGDWQRLAEWIATSAPKRSIHPLTALTRRQVAENERDFAENGVPSSLTSAINYDTTIPLARFLLSISAASTQMPLERAAFLRRYDLDRMPRDEAHWSRTATLLHDLPHSMPIGIGPHATTAKIEAEIADGLVRELKETATRR